MMVGLKDLKGKFIFGALCADSAIFLVCGHNQVIRLQPESECGNTVDIEHVSGAEFLHRAEVREVYVIGRYGKEPADDDNFTCSLNSWLVEIETNKGSCTIELRNTWNGYQYSGWLSILDFKAEPPADVQPLVDF